MDRANQAHRAEDDMDAAGAASRQELDEMRARQTKDVDQALDRIIGQHGKPDTIMPPDDNRLALAILDMRDNVEFDRTNTHKGYQYASADAIYAHVRKPLARQGLTIWMREVEFKPGEVINEKGHHWIWAKYEIGFQLNVLIPPPVESREIVTVCALMLGPEVCAAIRTFAQKYWIRGKCQLATGDLSEDLDDSKAPDKVQTRGQQGNQRQPQGNRNSAKKAEPKKPAAEFHVNSENDIEVRGKFDDSKALRREFYNFLFTFTAPNDKRTDDQKKLIRDVIAKNTTQILATYDGSDGGDGDSRIMATLAQHFDNSGLWPDGFTWPKSE